MHATARLEMAWHDDLPPVSSFISVTTHWLHCVFDEFPTITMGNAWHWHWSSQANYPAMWGAMSVAGCRVRAVMLREWEIMLISQQWASPNLRAANWVKTFRQGQHNNVRASSLKPDICSLYWRVHFWTLTKKRYRNIKTKKTINYQSVGSEHVNDFCS